MLSNSKNLIWIVNSSNLFFFSKFIPFIISSISGFVQELNSVEGERIENLFILFLDT